MGVVVASHVADVDEELLGLLETAVDAVLSHFGIPDAEVSVVLGDDELLHELNLAWRQVDAPTDVLAFALEEQEADEPFYDVAEGEPRLLGDVVISLPRAKTQAAEYGHDLSRELAFLAVHGALHLLGFDHHDEAERQQMRMYEEEILAKLGLGR
ncbi:MAG: rRNA maturation RNase YbeY [Firmicutes bacterium]|jgi:probable rRNA maturation factor|nr:rRNA maturation RNase YbeY [Bacillota bacterium]